jgi:hypothetical protein
MGKVSTISLVSAEALQRLWDENHMTEKRAAKLFVEKIAYSTPARDPRLAGGTSVIVLLFTRNGHHVGTVHEVILGDGTPSEHSHPKDYVLRDCNRVRIQHEEEKASHAKRTTRRHQQNP